jgi:hypothetical protein
MRRKSLHSPSAIARPLARLWPSGPPDQRTPFISIQMSQSPAMSIFQWYRRYFETPSWCSA